MLPADLEGKTPEWIARELFGEDLATTVTWALNRTDASTLEFADCRFAGPWKMSHGYLVALHEVGTRAQAKEFAKRNGIHLLDDGGLYHRSTAEFLVRASLPPQEEIASISDHYQVALSTGVEATLGYPSLPFLRLVAGPAADEFSGLPDPKTLTTIVLKGVDRHEIGAIAEQALFHFRQQFPGLLVLPGRVPDLLDAPEVQAELPLAGSRAGLPCTGRPEPIAFYNRAGESEPVLGFLYLYRVLEACFDDVLIDEIARWRNDSKLSELDLLKKVRKLTQKEDIWSLRQVLTIVDQAFLDRAAQDGLIPVASADALAEAIYSRRNSIAHGRRGQHDRVLVPFCISELDGAQGVHWRDMMREIADKALRKWVLGR